MIVDNPPDFTYVYTSRSFQIDADTFPDDRFRFIGPSLNARRHDSPAGLDLAALKRPLIYISMGTLLNKQRRLYRACIDAFAAVPVSVVMSIGRHTRAATLGVLPPNIRVYPWVPQLELLRHADLFITHGGMNSVNESIHARVPMLVIPQGNDQPAIADRVQELGLGIRVDPEHANSDRLRAASESILASPSIKTQLAAISHDMHTAGGNTRAAAEITRMVNAQRTRSRDT